MVDAIGPKRVTTSETVVAPTPRVVADAPAMPQRAAADTGGSSLAAAARAAAEKPPVQTDRVAQIKTAIANSTYPILPERIADRLIALSLNWRPE